MSLIYIWDPFCYCWSEHDSSASAFLLIYSYFFIAIGFCDYMARDREHLWTNFRLAMLPEFRRTDQTGLMVRGGGQLPRERALNQNSVLFILLHNYITIIE